MQRKLVKQGQNALTVTLPKEWTLAKGLNAGDFVDIAIDSDITISTQTKIQKKVTHINLSNLHKSQCWIMLQTLYINGYDTITITHTNQQDIILSIVDELIGMAVSSVSNSQITIYSLIATPEDSYEQVRKRVLFLFKEHGLMIGEKSQDEIKNHEHIMDKQVRFAMRYLSKYVSKPKYFDFLEMTTLEQAADLLTSLSKTTVTKKQKEKLHKLMDEFTSAHIKKDFQKIFTILYKYSTDTKTYADGLIFAFVECLYNYVGIVAHNYNLN
jgi:antitoxin component of MazEF toxin-antitoxin module